MAALLHARAERSFVSVPAWKAMLRRGEAGWLPIPSNVPTQLPSEFSEKRERLREGYGTVLGHFGTYGRLIAPLLSTSLERLLATDSERMALLVGRGAGSFAERFQQSHPALHSRVRALENASPEEVSIALSACDVAVQPYPDGISSRRTSAMASLALGVALATNEGRLSEPLWRQSQAVALADSPEGLPDTVEKLLADQQRRSQLAEAGRSLYQAEFSVARLIDRLRCVAEGKA
jgi:glycosyltransferase involved in cell wall biosynthesis